MTNKLEQIESVPCEHLRSANSIGVKDGLEMSDDKKNREVSAKKDYVAGYLAELIANSQDKRHGKTGYRYGCRCDKCTGVGRKNGTDKLGGNRSQISKNYKRGREPINHKLEHLETGDCRFTECIDRRVCKKIHTPSGCSSWTKLTAGAQRVASEVKIGRLEVVE